jgi:hypothetical protein
MLIRVSSMEKQSASALHVKQYRERLRAAGGAEVLFELPRETIAMIDYLKKRQGLPNRSLALLQLIERGMQTTQ